MADFRLSVLTPAQVALLRAVAAVAPRTAKPALVGGAIRDARLRRPVVDVDVAVAGGALAVAARVATRVGGSVIPLDAGRGVARVVAEGHRVDLADFRAPTLEGDLAARDFTVDALAVPLRALLTDGHAPIVDPTGGLRDLRDRRLRVPSAGALIDDPLRALRGVRLAVALGLRIVPATARAIRAVAPRVADVSAERARDELLAMLALPAAERALRLADRLGLLTVVLPEVEPMRRTRQPAPHRFDVLEHSLRAVGGADRVVARIGALAPFGEELASHVREPIAGGVDRGQALKLAALLHDVSKPETRRAVGGRVRFFEHDLRGAARVIEIGERWRLPERVTAVVERLVRHHLRPMHLGAAGEITPRARYRFYRDLGQETRDLVLLALVDGAAVRGQSPFVVWPHAGLLRDLLAGWTETRETVSAPPLLRGDDVMARYGLAPGPEVGRRLARVREAQDLGLVRTRAEALAFLDSSDGDS
ncbi:MAG: HD domain-containing protein [Candidatus Rokubacteria bacterium]|nr:HD domain-containing protein [Candidatus Rokubacteria bacterium]